MRLSGIAIVLFVWIAAPASAQTLQEQLLSEPIGDLASAARREGDPQRGAVVFHQPYLACARCHSAEEASPLGPSLSLLGKEGTAEHLIESILVPSKVIRKGFEPATVQTVDGKTFTGLLVEDSPQRLRLRDPSDGRIVSLAVSEIEERVNGRISIMPPGQANQLAGRQQFLDLVSYLIAIAEGGASRAAELQPPAALLVLQVPDYEADVDHAGMVSDLNRPETANAAYKRGEAIYMRLCINCHGTREQPGSLPTSLRFAEGKFKNGSDPYRLYRTLTYGYGLMAPQTWMVPQQKYDVIHYLREEYLRLHNPSQFVSTDTAYLASLPQGTTRGPEPVNIEPWALMNYGPFLSATYEVPSSGSKGADRGDRLNLAYKGIAVRLDSGPGGVARGRQWMLFEHDTLRWSAGWQTVPGSQPPNFIDWNGINFNGAHQIHPRTVGRVQFANPNGPGWAEPQTGSFGDQRILGRDGRRYGPLPSGWGTYRGLYQHGERIAVAYRVGETEILETPGLVEAPGQEAMLTRTLQVGPRERELTLLVATHPDPQALLAEVTVDGADQALFPVAVLSPSEQATRADTGRVSFDGRTHLDIANGDAFDLADEDYTITARLKTRLGGTILAQSKAVGPWTPNGKTFFVRGGKLCFDIGWVGAVVSRKSVDDGEWHDVALTWEFDTGRVQLWIDGRVDVAGTLKPKGDADGTTLRLGFTSKNFPEPQSYFQGNLEEVAFYPQLLTTEELTGLAREPRKVPEDPPLAHWRLDQLQEGRVIDLTGHGHDATLVRADSAGSDPKSLAAGISPRIEGAAWIAGPDGKLLLRLPAGPQPLTFTLAVQGLTEGAASADAEALALLAGRPATDLSVFQSGGPRRWPESLTTEIPPVSSTGPFAVESLPLPLNNPWFCQLRPTGFDFYADGDRAALCTWDGDVWLLSGLAAGQRLTWQRIASGLFQPLGLKLVDGQIFVTCRDQLVRLHDFNGDGETDFYECFNSDHQVTEHFHEFAMGLQTDSDGNFYYAKSARHALPAIVPQHGTLLKVSSGGQRTEIIAHGFRAANGVCLNPDGSFVVTDQEGHWNPKNRINWVEPLRPGEKPRFYGNLFGYTDITDPSDAAMEPPLCWITNAFDRSPAELLWLNHEAWGPLNGALLNLSYGYGKVFIVPHERVRLGTGPDARTVMQGGMVELPIPTFPCGIHRGRVHPRDGALYLCGMFAWAGNATQPGGFYRVRPSGQPVHVPIEVHARSAELSLTFPEPISRPSANNSANFTVKVWDLKRTANYGSQHYNERALAVRAATLSADGRTVTLDIPQLAPTWCMSVSYSLSSEAGTPFRGVMHNTIHSLEAP